MNKRDNLLNLINSASAPEHIPAAFFLHFDHAHHQGQAAIDKHLDFFRATGMDFVKIQYEQEQPPADIRKPEDWANVPLYPQEYFDATVGVTKGLVQAADGQALVLMTLYSPFMWTKQLSSDLNTHFQQNPDAVKKGLDIMTQNVITLVRACKQAGIDGFYASTQGGEAFRFPGADIFKKYIKPTDLIVWQELADCKFNILHICDFDGGYNDLTPFLDYPGHVVNSSLNVGDHTVTPKEMEQMFTRPFMGGMDRHGVLATGAPDEIRAAVSDVLAQAPERFMLGADCTVLGNTPWDNLKIAIDTAHQSRK